MRARKPHIGGIFYPKFRVPHLNPWLCFLHHFCACPSALQGWLFAHVISQHLLAGRANNCTANKNSRGNKNTAGQGISRCNLLNSICLPAPPEWWGGGGHFICLCPGGSRYLWHQREEGRVDWSKVSWDLWPWRAAMPFGTEGKNLWE